MTKLISAIYNKDIEKVKKLLARASVDVNKKDRHGYTALQFATGANYDTEILKLVLAHKHINLLDEDEHGRTALHIARLWRYKEVVELLETAMN